MIFSKAQTFYVDPDAVGGADNIYLLNVNLFFQSLPSSNNNLSGITNPGVSVMIAQTDANDAPISTSLIADSYTEVFSANIVTSNDASLATVFAFDSPIPVQTGFYYAIMIQMDTPEFMLWEDVVGDFLVGSTTPSSGPSGKYSGAYYELGSDGTLAAQTKTALKFVINIAQFTSSTTEVDLINDSYEFINYDSISNTYIGGESVFQDFGGYANGALQSNVTFYSKGTLLISSNSTTITGTGTSFTNASTGFISGDQIVYTDGTTGNTDIRSINAVPNDSIIILNEAPSFSNNAANFKKTAIALIFNTDYPNNQLIFNESTSNSSVQFSSSSVKTYTIVAGGSGYNNTDFISVTGSTVNAAANIGTNSIGGIISINITNSGFGVTNTGTLSINSANGGSSNGSTGNIVAILGATIRGSLSGSYCNLNSFYDYHIASFTPEVLVKVPDVAVTNLFANFSNSSHFVVPANEFEVVADQYTLSPFDTTILSRAVEINTPNSQLAFINTVSGGIYKSAYLRAELSVNSSNALLFTSPYIYEEKLDIMTYVNQINNSDYGETTNTGNATSKSISTSLTFANNGLANTLRLYSSTYMPIGTTVEWFAKVVNFNDPESFSSKNWTPLALTGGVGQFSSLVDKENFIQYTFSVPPYPKSLFTCPGVVTVANTGNVVITTSSDFSANLSAGDLIKVYSPVFSNDYFITVVSSVNTSAVVVTSGTTNNSVSGAGFVIDKIDPLYKNTAFSDPQNNGVLTYYNSGMVKFAQFSTMAFKPLLLSNSSYIVPRVSDYRAVGVSA